MQKWLSSALVGSVIGYTATTMFLNRNQKPTTIIEKESTSKWPLTERAKEILKYGPDIDEQENIRVRQNYVSSLNFRTKTPNWVAEHHTAENLKGDGNRSNIQFMADESVDAKFRAENSDYFHSGYTRGHLAPAGHNKQSMAAMRDTFLLNSNIVPQEYYNNGYYWYRMEIFCRDLVKQFANVYVISGPLYLAEPIDPSSKEKQHPIVKYPIIGKNHVAVPTHLFKIIVTENNSNEKSAAAFVAPNKNVPDADHLTKYQVPIAEVEHYGGFNALPKLDNFTDLCKVTGCNMVDAREHKRFMLTRELEGSFNSHFLETAWKTLNDEGFTITDGMKATYESKKAAFAAKSQKA